MSSSRKTHWETVYETKEPNQVSWTQEIPKTSLDFSKDFNLPKNAKIIDVGGGDSKLVDFLLNEAFTNITVLDISAKALEKAKARLEKKRIRQLGLSAILPNLNPQQNSIYGTTELHSTF